MSIAIKVFEIDPQNEDILKVVGDFDQFRSYVRRIQERDELRDRIIKLKVTIVKNTGIFGDKAIRNEAQIELTNLEKILNDYHDV